MNEQLGEFPGGPVVRTRLFHCRGPHLIPGPGSKIPQAAQRGQKKKKKRERIKKNEQLSLRASSENF